MNNLSDNERFKKGYEYAVSIISEVNTYMEFAVAMLDYMGEDFPDCKSLYASMGDLQGLKDKIQDYDEWRHISNAEVVAQFKRFKEKQQKQTMQEQEIKDNVDELQSLVRQYSSSDKFKKMLDFVARPSHLALYNAMLVQVQKPGATIVHTEANWRQYNRRPKLNAQPLVTLIPFGPVQLMFDYSDTEQIPWISEVKEQKLLDDWYNCLIKAKGKISDTKLKHLISNLALYGVFLDREFNAADTFGGYIMRDHSHKLSFCYRGKDISEYSFFSISINKNQAEAAMFHILCHELGHLFCRHLYYNEDKRRELTIKEREFEAETVAWLVCKRNGIHNPSEEYLACYAKDGKLPNPHIGYIVKAVAEIEKMMAGRVKITDSLWYKEDVYIRQALRDKYNIKDSQKSNKKILFVRHIT